MVIISVAAQGGKSKVNGKSLPAVALSALMCFVGLQGCASTSAPVPATIPPQVASPVSKSTAVSKDMVTVENLLRWPLEGPEGVDKVISGLRQVFDVEPLTGGGFYAKGVVPLADGYMLNFTDFYPTLRDADIGVQQTPCFSPERAVEITGAVMDPVFRTDHGVDLGHTYDARRNGVWVSFTSTPETYQCVSSIHIRSTTSAQP